MEPRRLLAVAVVLGAAGGAYLSFSGPVVAQSTPVRTSVYLTLPDGGPLPVELSTSSLGALADPECDRGTWQGLSIDGGVTAIPYAQPDGGGGPLLGRTQAVIVYASTKGYARCDCPDVGQPMPDCGATRWRGKTLDPGATASWTGMRAGTPCYCVVCSAAAGGLSHVEILEGACR